MGKYIYRGSSDRAEIDGLVIEKDGEPVELTDEQLMRFGSDDIFEEYSSLISENVESGPEKEGE